MSKHASGAGKRWSERTEAQRKETLRYAEETLSWRAKGQVPQIRESGNESKDRDKETYKYDPLEELALEHGKEFVNQTIMNGKVALLLSGSEVKTTFISGEGVAVDYALLALGVRPISVKHHYLTNNTKCVYNFSQEQLEVLSQEKAKFEEAMKGNKTQTFVDRVSSLSLNQEGFGTKL